MNAPENITLDFILIATFLLNFLSLDFLFPSPVGKMSYSQRDMDQKETAKLLCLTRTLEYLSAYCTPLAPSRFCIIKLKFKLNEAQMPKKISKYYRPFELTSFYTEIVKGHSYCKKKSIGQSPSISSKAIIFSKRKSLSFIAPLIRAASLSRYNV